VFGEPGAIVYLADCVDLMKIIPSGSVDVVFADPPYRLSRGGVTVKSGRLAPVDKGTWDRSMGVKECVALGTCETQWRWLCCKGLLPPSLGLVIIGLVIRKDSYLFCFWMGAALGDKL
jgi:hypothetical protein